MSYWSLRRTSRRRELAVACALILGAVGAPGVAVAARFIGPMLGQIATPTQDTDLDAAADHLDPDDDNDGVATRFESPDPEGDCNQHGVS